MSYILTIAQATVNSIPGQQPIITASTLTTDCVKTPLHDSVTAAKATWDKWAAEQRKYYLQGKGNWTEVPEEDDSRFTLRFHSNLANGTEMSVVLRGQVIKVG